MLSPLPATNVIEKFFDVVAIVHDCMKDIGTEVPVGGDGFCQVSARADRSALIRQCGEIETPGSTTAMRTATTDRMNRAPRRIHGLGSSA
jgi:hypothetical protein